MANWKTKLFGDNRMNFYTWIVGGLLVIIVSLGFAIRALGAGAVVSPESWLLFAICLVLLGQFGLGLQNYCARVGQKLDKQDEKRNDTNAT